MEPDAGHGPKMLREWRGGSPEAGVSAMSSVADNLRESLVDSQRNQSPVEEPLLYMTDSERHQLRVTGVWSRTNARAAAFDGVPLATEKWQFS